MRIACVGEAMIELSLDEGLSKIGFGFAGDTLNTAVYLRRNLAPEHDIAFVSAVGTDEFSNRMVHFIANQGVLVNNIERFADLLPGIYTISLDEAGDRSFNYWRENSAARRLFQMPDGTPCFKNLQSFDVIYASAISLAILPAQIREAFLVWIKAFRKNGGLFAFDSNYRPQLWESPEEARRIIEHAWKLCDIALPSMDDEMAIFGDSSCKEILDRFERYGVKAGALKRGVTGPLPIGTTIEKSIVFLPAEKVVDSTAAGDSFSGAYLAEFLISGNPENALLAGHMCARTVVQHRGAITENCSD